MPNKSTAYVPIQVSLMWTIVIVIAHTMAGMKINIISRSRMETRQVRIKCWIQSSRASLTGYVGVSGCVTHYMCSPQYMYACFVTACDNYEQEISEVQSSMQTQI